MSNEVIKSFLAEFGFKADLGEAKRVVEVNQQVENAITKASTDGADKRTDAEKQASTERIGITAGLKQILVSMEQDRADRAAKIRKDEAAKDEKLQEERERKAKERRARALKEMRSAITTTVSYALKAVTAVEATALGIVFATEKAARGFERLNYAAKRNGSTPGAMTAAGYAFGQLGSTKESGQAAVTAIGSNLKNNPLGYASAFKSLGIEVRQANGAMRDAGDLAVDLGDKLRKVQKEGGAYGYAQATGRAAMFGLDEEQAQVIMDPRYRQKVEEQKAIDAKSGANRDAAAEGGTKFETALRKLDAMLDSIKTKVETSLFATLTPKLEAMGKWADEHGEQIAAAVSHIADAIIKFGAALVEQLAQVNWDEVLKKVEKFCEGFEKTIQDVFGDGGLATKAVIAFGAVVAANLLGPLNLVLTTLIAIGKVPLVGRLVGGAVSTAATAAASAPAVVAGTILAGGAAAGAEKAPMVDEFGRVTGNWGGDTDHPFGQGEDSKPRPTTTFSTLWDKLKGMVGLGETDPDAKRVKDAILQTAEGVKKLADKQDGMGGGGGMAGGVGGAIGAGGGGPNMRYGRDGSGGYRHGGHGAAGGVGTFSTDMPPEARALLDTLASGEAKDYNVLNGGGTFSGYGQHPFPYKGGRAAGRYQFLGSTWLGVQRQLGLPDFSPGNQDKGAWFLAQRDYRLRTGRDLASDLKSKEPGRIAAIGQALHPTWVSTNGQFADRYAGFLAKPAGTTAGANAPGQVHGELKIGDETYRYGSGGASGSAHVPYGTYPINPESEGAWGKAHNAMDVGPNGSMWDDALGRMRVGIEMHAASTAEMVTHGCLGFMKEQYPQLKARVREMIQQYGHAYLHINENGATITPTKDGSGPVKGVVDAKEKAQEEVKKQVKDAVGSVRHGKPLPSWMAKDGTDKGIVTVDYRDQRYAPGGSSDKPVHVEVTDKSAHKIGQGVGRMAFAAYARGNKAIGPLVRKGVEAHARSVEANAHLAATQAMLRVQHGHFIPGINPHSSLSTSMRHSLHNTQNNANVTHNPTYNIQGGEPRQMLDDAHRHAERQQSTLIRNLNVSVS